VSRRKRVLGIDEADLILRPDGRVYLSLEEACVDKNNLQGVAGEVTFHYVRTRNLGGFIAIAPDMK